MTLANESTTFKLIHNPDFVAWVLSPSSESDQFWADYLYENPSQKRELGNARFIIKGLIWKEKSITEAEISALWDKIELTRNSGTKKLIYLKRWSAAAGILLILGISGWLITQRSTPKLNAIDYHSIAIHVDSCNEIKLILADHTQKIFNTKELELKYSKEGKLETKTGKQVQTEELIKSSETLQMNQLVVPRGKRSYVELADGTKLWLNSGSHAIYPVVFNGKKREIYIEGEGYFEVAHNASKPFFVVTDHIKVKVLGTKFDISAYKDDAHVSVVLAEGSVEASSAIENLVMKPNQIVIYEKLTQKSTLEKTNVLEYVSWKEGWLLCNKEPIQSITTKLSRYYDIKVISNNLKLNSMSLTGKLDLKSNCEDVFKVICTTAPLKYQIIDNTIYLTAK